MPNKIKTRQVLQNGQFKEVPESEVDYEFDSPSTIYNNTINLVPFQNAVQAARTFYSDKFINQSVPLVNGEAPYVSTLKDPSTNESFQHYLGLKTGVVSANADDNDSTVTEITPNYIKLKSSKGKTYEKPLYNNQSFNRKTFVTNTPIVKVGDKVKSGQILAKTNYTDDNGDLAMGLNARVAVVPYKGWTYEDSLVVSQDFANRMASEQMYGFNQDKDSPDSGLKTGKTHYTALYPDKFNKDQLSNIDDNGVIKEGTIVHKGDPLILSTKARVISSNDAELGRLSKYLKNTRNDASITWDHDADGEVTDVVKNKSGWVVNVKSKTPIVPGDKITTLNGNKSTISQVIPMNQMPRTLDGKPVDIIFNPLAWPSRVNAAAMYSLMLGKVAEKTGKRYVLPSYNKSNESWYDMVEKELKDNNLSDVEPLYDPLEDRVLDNPVVVGNDYFVKLHHLGESKLSARSTGIYSGDLQPLKGGDEGAKSKRYSGLENAAIISSGAYNIIKDAIQLRGQKNDDYWRAVRMGETPHLSKTSPFVWDKYLAIMQGAGLNALERGNGVMQMSPFTDKQFERMLPVELENAHIVDLKDLKPVKGGLFDPAMSLTNKWGKITLTEPYPNPGFEDAITSLLGIKKSDIYDIMKGEKSLSKYGTGNIAIRKALADIDMDSMLKDSKEAFKSGPKSSKQKALNRIRYIDGLQKNGLTPDELMISRIPVLPTKFRPYSIMGDTFLPGDANELYKDVFQMNQVQKELRDELGNDSMRENAINMYNSIKALYGFGDSMNKKLQQRGVSGFMDKLVGGTSKFSYLNRAVNSKPVDMSGRSVIEMSPELTMDEIDLPNKIAYKIFAPYIQGELVKNGMKPKDAIKAIEEMDENTAGKALNAVMKRRPVWYSRAPSWHRYNVLSGWARRHEGNNILISPVVSTGLTADNDGDCQIAHIYVAIKK